MYQIGVFATGRGQGSRQLLQVIHHAIQSGHLPARIAFVFSNREPGEFEATDGFFTMVGEMGHPLVTYSFRKFRDALGDDPEWRIKYDREVMRCLAPYAPDLCVLAGYLMIFGPELCRRYTSVNLHPAAPGGPVGMWQKVIWELIETRARSSGNTIFYVTEELDKGPTVTYCTFPLTGGELDEAWAAVEGKAVDQLREQHGEELPLFQLIRQRGTAREQPLVVETLRAFAQGSIRIDQADVVDAQGKAIRGIDLTKRIEAHLRSGGG
ncbi:MAG: formyltransferase family protein [Dehalococcoidia bacterium]